jgi:S1-C subfamily serine protease
MRREIERDFAIKYVGVSVAVTTALVTCSAQLERYALAGCVGGIILPGEQKSDAEARHKKYCVQAKHEAQMEAWVPVLLRRRVELQPDGPRYLYDFASRFVYAVVAKNGNVTVQGSAVAVDDQHLATNCHVVDGATSITIHAGKNQIAARPSKHPLAKHGSDRCLLFADSKLPAFAAIREWDSLNVGERIFAIGVPQGLVLDLSLTLSDGILSGKRTDGKHRLIQTTAPISQGSSGGGLFDSSGRLLGITTFALTRGQSLNFAIAAEDWRYELCFAQAFFFGPSPDCKRYIPVP